MLVLGRKPGEQIVVPGCQVTVTVLGISGSRVRLGIKAPPDTLVHRREIWDKMLSSETAAVPSPQPPEDARLPRLQVGKPCAAEAVSGAAATGRRQRRLASHIQRWTHGQICGLRVEAEGERLIVHGRTSSCYARQLAQEATMRFLQDASPASEAHGVTFKIDVAGHQNHRNPEALDQLRSEILRLQIRVEELTKRQ